MFGGGERGACSQENGHFCGHGRAGNYVHRRGLRKTVTHSDQYEVKMSHSWREYNSLDSAQRHDLKNPAEVHLTFFLGSIKALSFFPAAKT